MVIGVGVHGVGLSVDVGGVVQVEGRLKVRLGPPLLPCQNCISVKRIDGYLGVIVERSSKVSAPHAQQFHFFFSSRCSPSVFPIAARVAATRRVNFRSLNFGLLFTRAIRCESE